MKWETAKTLIIVCLAALNIILSLMIESNKTQYSLSSQRQETILEVLEKNNIFVDGELLKSFEPKKSIEMSAFSQNKSEIKNIFWGREKDARLTTEFDKLIYTLEDEKLTISNSNILYEIPNGTDEIVLTEESARRIAEEYLIAIGKSNFEFNLLTIRDSYILVDFRERFKNDILYCNYFQFKVSEKGIIEIRGVYNPPVDFYGYEQDICAADEALLNFMQNIRKIYIETEPLTITRIDLVYYQNVNITERDTNIRATPHYRIYLKDRVEPFLINAFSNNML